MISQQEILSRKQKICRLLDEKGLDGILLTEYANIVYVSQFFHVTTERPVCLYLNGDGSTVLFVPSLEKEQASRLESVDKVEFYFEYPGLFDIHSWIFSTLKSSFPSSNRIGVDGDSHRLLTKLEQSFGFAAPCNAVSQLRLIKSDEEVEMLKKAAYFNDYMVKCGLELVKPGISELELLSLIQNKTITKMIAELDRVVFTGGGVATGLIPSGEQSALPHALPSARIIQSGDSMMFSMGASVEGYITECERTCFIGSPTQKHIEAFKVMQSAQELSTSLMVEGAVCADVDKAVLDYIKRCGYGDFIRHRSGHGKGLLKHEAPWVECGDKTVLRAGMVLSSEPALYIEGFAGFRHSDTLVVQKGAPLVLTKFPKDLQSLTACV